MSYQLIYRQYNERSVLIQWPHLIDQAILKDINEFKKAIELHVPKSYSVISYSELLLEFPSYIEDYSELVKELKKLYQNKEEGNYKSSLIRIPVCYDPLFGVDQEQLFDDLKLSLEELVELHTKNTYTVFAIGFLPGFMYLGGLDKRLYHPRLIHPREKVPKGSVGIAGMQTGIYPGESPGGWQLIGRSPLDLFKVENDPPCFVSVGDKIQFYPINMDEYQLISIQIETKIYQLDKTPYVY